MFCRVALHEKTPGSVASDDARGFRKWVKEQPGFVDGYHVQDSETGRMYSVNGSGPVGDAFGPRHARAVGAAVEVALRLDAVADHLHAAILASGS